ncbi:hypothetical protein PHYSODRAFT_247813 [Phytophthora sojae]|uniref:Uncharacterized protein n=1 Tax=Phytophthora sojae (strain P6497) TaxID=1094619 RepID=G4YZM6_PHYSP|nr:hypothetical protein PHYSODRAFT_247813 [Phytophthora sojae]EGZ25794.1 hypothetical protein PHYSODRAFT_247813 [Phytophthora sojae]|eukprot:XP_009521082.1 hypothetical protein PHYSODRAFT_247813 [Phytophthora sojae]
MSTPENKIVPAASPGRRAGVRGRGRGARQVSRPLQLPAPLPEPAQDPGMSARVEQQLALAESPRPTSTQSTPRRSPRELVPRSTQSSPGRPTFRDVPALPQPPLELALSPAAESALGKRDHLVLRGHHETTTVPGNGAHVRLGLAPGAQVLGPELPPPRGHALPRGSLPVIPRGVSGEVGGGSGQLVSVADDEARAYGVEQLRRWVALPGEVISPVDIVYDEAEDEYDIRYLGLLNAGRLSESWIKMLSVRRRRQPLVTDLRATSVSPKLPPQLSCVALLQTMLMEAGFEFCNVVPIWSSIPELAAVSENQIRHGVEEVQARVAVECLEWNKLMRGVGFHIRQSLDQLPEVRPVSPADNQARDEEGDILMTDDTVELLGLQLPPPQSPALSVTGPLVPVMGMETMAREDSVPSVVGPSGDSDQSMHAGEATDLSGHSSSGSSFLSAADMAGSALSHMPGPSAVAMVMIAQTSSAAAADPQGFGVSVPVAAYRVHPKCLSDKTRQ